MDINQITKRIIGCAIEVHKILGQGLPETVYEKCLIYEIQNANLKVQQQVFVPITYKEMTFDSDYTIRLLIENKVIVELTTEKEITNIQQTQILACLKFAKIKTALLFNFNTPLLKNGIKRYAN